MKLATRLLLAGVLAASFAVTGTASANDCSNPKTPCGGCSLNPNVLEDLDLADPQVRDVVRCYPV